MIVELVFGYLVATHFTLSRGVVLLEMLILPFDRYGFLTDLTESDVPPTVGLMDLKCAHTDVPLTGRGKREKEQESFVG